MSADLQQSLSRQCYPRLCTVNRPQSRRMSYRRWRLLWSRAIDSVPGLPSAAAAAASLRVLCPWRGCCGSSTFWRLNRGELNGLARASSVRDDGYMMVSCLLSQMRQSEIPVSAELAQDGNKIHSPRPTHAHIHTSTSELRNAMSRAG